MLIQMNYNSWVCGVPLTFGDPAPNPPSTTLAIQLIPCPASTVLLRVSGESMQGAGISHGDLLIVERCLEARAGQVVVAWLEGGFTLKRLAWHRGRLRLEAAHPAYPPLELAPAGGPQIWGVARHVIRTLVPDTSQP